MFDKQGDIVEVPDDESIKARGFSFLSVEEIKALDQTRAVDLIGIVCAVDPVNNCTLKSGAQKDKRMVSICDESGMFI